jgi:hypothetical protein
MMDDQLYVTPEPVRADASRAPAGTQAEDGEPPDLSGRIAAGLAKRPSDRVTCRRVFGNNYRCNWWAPAPTSGYDNPSMGGSTVTTHRVRKSQFLRVTSTFKGLVIDVL